MKSETALFSADPGSIPTAAETLIDTDHPCFKLIGDFIRLIATLNNRAQPIG